MFRAINLHFQPIIKKWDPVKTLFAFLMLISAFAQANQKCELKMIEQLNLGRTLVTKLSLGSETARYQIYALNTTLDGGDALMEVAVRKSDCKVLDTQYVWSE